jgi:hypothetical protein
MKFFYSVCQLIVFVFFFYNGQAQLNWKNVDAEFNTGKGLHVYFCNDSLDGRPFRAYYVKANLKDKQLEFTVDTAYARRLTPSQFYKKNREPEVVVNCTFFSFQTNQNLNLVMRNGKLLAYNVHTVAGKGKDTFTYRHPLASALGISKRRVADVAWTFTDSSLKKPYAIQWVSGSVKDSSVSISFEQMKQQTGIIVKPHQGQWFSSFKKWPMQTAIGGGPVLLQNGEIKITNNEELKFAGKAINDLHPRTAMGYTKNKELIILVVQGRSESADGISLVQEAQLLVDLGCVEALNLDGGGSSCMLVNGKETIKPSDKEGERPVPAVFIIKRK